MMTAYREVFGTAGQPNRPARSTMQVAGLVDPGWLVEIEVTAAAPGRLRRKRLGRSQIGASPMRRLTVAPISARLATKGEARPWH